MHDWAARWRVRWRLLVVAAAGVTFVVVLFAGQWLLPGVVDWAARWTTAEWAASGLAKLRDDGAWALAGLAATGVLTAGLLRRPNPPQPSSDAPRQPGERVLFGEIPHRAWSFQERPDLTAKVVQALEDRSAAALVALHGMRGAGKSQLAAQVARQCAGHGFDVVAWINAESGVVPELARLGREEFRLAGDGVLPEQVAAAVRRLLERVDGRRRLVVFDNVEDPAELVRYLPSTGSTQVIITTNRPAVATLPGVASVEVGVFQPEQGHAFLAEATRLPDGEDAQRLGEQLGWLPLGLAQAAANIAADRLSYRQYLDLLSGVRLDEILRQQAGAEHPGVLKATGLSLAALRRDDPTSQANRLLTVLALLSSDGISRRFLTGPAATAAFAPARRWWRAWRRASGIDARRALPLLTGRSVVAISAVGVDGEGDRAVVVVHRLIAAVVRYQAGIDGSFSTAVTDATRLLDQLTDDLPTDQVAHRRADLDELVRHIESVREHVEKPSELLLIQRSWAGRALTDAGDLTRAISILEATLADRLRVLGAYHPDTLASRTSLADAYQSAGRLDKAIDLHEQVLADRARVLGADHPDTLTSRTSLAHAYQSAGRLDEAIDLHEQVLADCLRVLGADHHTRLLTRNNLAYAYHAAGRLDEAIDLYEQVLADCLRVLGADHPDTLTSRSNLADAYQSAGRLDEAIDLCERVLAVRVRLLGADHPHTLVSRHALASAYQSAGRLDEAIDLHEQVLADCLRVLGADHPDTLKSRHLLARAYQAGRLDEAIDLYERVLGDYLRVLGADHPHTLVSRYELAGAYRSAGRLDEAIDLYERVLADYLRAFGADHPHTLVSRHGLAGAYQSAGRLDEAIDLHEQVLADYLRAFGADHPHTLVSRHGLADAYQSTGRLDEAIDLYENLLADCERLLSPSHPLTSQVRSSLARAPRSDRGGGDLSPGVR
ncbi:tetratricopeptide repeat protein [Catellatospora tritici]|uniref:tetratricopeptide repeat protein n=1 Tax=Catellatospora tritici TaxID=2851566 RepID=UPI001C2D1A8C|nr:tetratricopeptide repeat protein [Catellatospora tritici]MBV1854571.1 tetratricopeptide repeat protein [Catellatospora tritici]